MVWPTVSILLPARDEARGIAACVGSLLPQRYPQFELLVLDDQSTDATPDILHALAAADPRLSPLAGQPLPPGWLGKHWACQQLFEQAHGELLLFTDADTIHQPQALRQAVAALLAEKADLVSVLPRQELGSWGERLVVPLLPWSLATFYPQRLTRRLLGFPLIPDRFSTALTMAVGQFMLFRREAYVRAGGHAAVRAHAADDIALARALPGHGERCCLLDAGELVTCRMYHGFDEASQGLSKNLSAAFNYSLLALLAVSLGAATWTLSAARFRLPWVVVLLSPAIVLTGAALALRSWRLTRAGQTIWKSRLLPAVR
jgi:chlorobactene glucosyltransferase